MKNSVILATLALFSCLIAANAHAKSLNCTMHDQVLDVNLPKSLSIDVGNKYGGQFKSQGQVYRWTILPNGESYMTADGNETVYAALYVCSVAQ